MKCPHCSKEVFGKSHDVSDLYKEPKELTREEQLEAENKRLIELHRWIPVGERLPESIKQLHYSRDVLIVQSDWGLCTAYYQNVDQLWVIYGSYERPQEYQNKITHWKPIILPQQVVKESPTELNGVDNVQTSGTD